MNAAQKITAFVAGLAVVFAVAVFGGIAGDYRLFLDFQHAGVVRTAEFTVSVGDGETR
jgi:hypothetical protein